MTQAFDWMKLAKNSTSRRDCTLLCSNVGYLILKLFYYHLKKGPFKLTDQGSLEKLKDGQPRIRLRSVLQLVCFSRFGSW